MLCGLYRLGPASPTIDEHLGSRRFAIGIYPMFSHLISPATIRSTRSATLTRSAPSASIPAVVPL
jgi:hypothetical protein